MGRRKLVITPIMTLSKRKRGLIKKANELAVLCGVELALIMFTPNNKHVQYSSGDIDATLLRFSNTQHPAEFEKIAQRNGGAENTGEDGDSDDESNGFPSNDNIATPSQFVQQQMLMSPGQPKLTTGGQSLKIDTSPAMSPSAHLHVLQSPTHPVFSPSDLFADSAQQHVTRGTSSQEQMLISPTNVGADFFADSPTVAANSSSAKFSMLNKKRQNSITQQQVEDTIQVQHPTPQHRDKKGRRSQSFAQQ